MEQEQILEVRNADQPPVESASVTTQNVEPPKTINLESLDPITEPSEKVEAPKEDQNRYEYWQSQADKAKGELSALREEVEYYRNNPAPQQAQQPQPSNGQPQGYPDNQGFQEPLLKEPIRPDRPVNYNELDAYNDAESESFKYRLANERYRDERVEYLENKDLLREEQMQAEYQRNMQMQRESMMQQQAQSHAVNNYGWDNNKANEFVQWASNPTNLTVDNLAKLFELRQNPNPVVQQRTQQMQNQAQVLNVPKPATVVNGKTEQPRNDQQVFSDLLLGRN